MEKIVLDTNFILSCVKQKIYLFEQLRETFGIYDLIVPEQIFDELKKISKDKESKIKNRESTKVALQLLKKYKFIDLGTKDVDAGILRYIKDKEKIYVATLDKELKKKIKQKNSSVKFLTIVKKKRIVIQ